jgi:hypothetical protein
MPVALAAVFGAGGCSSGSSSSGGSVQDCETECAKSKQQGCESQSLDCASHCQGYLGTMAAAGCTDQFDQFISCVLAQPDVCTTQSPCVSQLAAWGSCIDPYCKQHATDPTCVSIE